MLDIAVVHSFKRAHIIGIFYNCQDPKMSGSVRILLQNGEQTSVFCQVLPNWNTSSSAELCITFAHLMSFDMANFAVDT
jgi:hypothetical protein